MPDMLSLILAMTMTLASPMPAPDFTHHAPSDWINSAPLTLQALRGKVVIVEFWTFACSNCIGSTPWLNDLHARLRERGLLLVGVHTPELPHERVAASVRRKVGDYGIRYPVMLDNDFSYWKALSNQYWPAFYLIDKQGRVRAAYFGETHAGDAQAHRIERDLETLLAEPG
jgi:thiol-disulfide isomerase/thioredoxin